MQLLKEDRIYIYGVILLYWCFVTFLLTTWFSSCRLFDTGNLKSVDDMMGRGHMVLTNSLIYILISIFNGLGLVLLAFYKKDK